MSYKKFLTNVSVKVPVAHAINTRFFFLSGLVASHLNFAKSDLILSEVCV